MRTSIRRVPLVIAAVLLPVALVAVPAASARSAHREALRSERDRLHDQVASGRTGAFGLSLLLTHRSLKLVPVPTTTVPPHTFTAPPPAASPAASVAPSPAPPDSVSSTTGPPPVGAATAWGCGPALQYLQAHAAPGFVFQCPGYAQGHQAMTCIDVPGVCSDENLIAISDPCPSAYMNEAHNSWVLSNEEFGTPLPAGTGDGIDPYGYC